MGTVNKEIADAIIRGEYPEDEILRIVRYTNAWGGDSYGLVSKGQPVNTYAASDFVKNPTVYWVRSPKTSMYDEGYWDEKAADENWKAEAADDLRRDFPDKDI